MIYLCSPGHRSETASFLTGLDLREDREDVCLETFPCTRFEMETVVKRVPYLARLTELIKKGPEEAS